MAGQEFEPRSNEPQLSHFCWMGGECNLSNYDENLKGSETMAYYILLLLIIM